jgi:hypothetical protein
MKIPFVRLTTACFLLSLPASVFAAEVSVDATSIVRFEQKDLGYKKDFYVPGTQFLGIDADKLADGNLSLHLYGWGRGDLGDKSYNSDLQSGALNYGYLQYRFNKSSDIRAGRVFVREGIVNEHIDGASFHVEAPYGFSISGFGGAPVHTANLYGENTDGKGTYIVGGRGSFRYKGLLELGASGVFEGNQPVMVNHPYSGREYIGGDIWFSPFKSIEVMGHTSYNYETKKVAENSYLLNIKPLKHLVLTGEYNDHREQSYLYSWAMFRGSSINPSEMSRSYGGSISYQLSKPLEIVADYKHYMRDAIGGNTNGGDADRYGADVKMSFLENSFRSGLGYKYLRASDGFAISGTESASYHMARAYAMHDTKTYFASVDAIAYIFAKKVYNEKSAWEAMGSLGYHITPDLAASGDISYGRNPEFTEELKGLVRLTYNMSFDSKGGKK